jgi:hypothetical protein
MVPAGTYSPAPTERVQTLHAWVNNAIIARIVAGGMKEVSSSIQSRIYNALSDAMLGYEQCKKLCAACKSCCACCLL